VIDPRPGPPSKAVDEFLAERVAAGIFPGASYLVAEGDRVTAEGAAGRAVLVPTAIAATTTTLYDLASLTKPLATALLAVRLQALGRLRLEDRLARHLPEWETGDARDELTLLDLLTHRSGLAAWDPLYVYARDVATRIERVRVLPPAHAPLLGVTYSCPNFLLLGFALARAGGARLDELFDTLVRGPLGNPEILYRPAASLRPRVAATERGNARERHLAGEAGALYNAWRDEIIWGQVHDNNAHTLDGIAGNAGLFGTARGVAAVARLFLPGGGDAIGEDERALFSHDFTPGLAQSRSVGFQLARTEGSSAGPALPGEAFGHTGFTGTSVWIDPVARRILVLLTNRVHPTFHDVDMNAVRRAFHALAARV
jgi:serine-type D-Ala-D-Ala carboxypeptidase